MRKAAIKRWGDPIERAFISSLLKGRPNLFLRGKKFTEQHRKNLSNAHKGKPSSKKGVKISDETKKRISSSLIGKKPTQEARKNHLAAMRRPEVGEKLKIISLANWKKGYLRKKMLKHQRKGFKAGWYESPIAGKVYLKSSYEKIIARWLDKYHFDWSYETIAIPYHFENYEHTYIVDFEIKKPISYCIECKGWKEDLDEIKWSAFRDVYPKRKLVIVDEKKIKMYEGGLELCL